MLSVYVEVVTRTARERKSVSDGEPNAMRRKLSDLTVAAVASFAVNCRY